MQMLKEDYAMATALRLCYIAGFVGPMLGNVDHPIWKVYGPAAPR